MQRNGRGHIATMDPACGPTSTVPGGGTASSWTEPRGSRLQLNEHVGSQCVVWVTGLQKSYMESQRQGLPGVTNMILQTTHHLVCCRFRAHITVLSWT